jgi:hypothetical protein
MEKLPIWFALHGAAVLGISFVAGILLHRAIRLGTGDVAAWHLAHAGGSGRGVLLIALAGVLRWVALPQSQLLVFVGLMLFFVWTSTAAMVIAAVTGARGLGWNGPFVNMLVYVLYIVGAVAVFPATALLIVGLLRSLD